MEFHIIFCNTIDTRQICTDLMEDRNVNQGDSQKASYSKSVLLLIMKNTRIKAMHFGIDHKTSHSQIIPCIILSFCTDSTSSLKSNL